MNLSRIIKFIRDSLALSQDELAIKIGVERLAVVRWENEKATPNKMAQVKLCEIAKENKVKIYDFVVNDLPQHLIKGNLLTLYHGSKTGIEGDIKPDSRVRCDFGKGFYMATQIQEALTLICSNSETVLYVVALDLTGLKVVTIPSDIDWAMLVAYYRGRLNHVKGTQLYEKYSTMLLGCDIVVGSIVSDRLFLALDRFFEGIITDKGLIESLSALQQGKQYVAISQKACNQIKIVRKEKLPLLVRLCIEDISEANRQYGISTATDICRNYRRDGRFFDEILKESR